MQGFVVLTGDPNTRNIGGYRNTWGQGGSSTTVQLEMDPSVHNHYDYLGMVRRKSSNPNSGSSQFYINVANNTSSLDGRYTIFGKVVNGADAAVAISNIPLGDCK